MGFWSDFKAKRALKSATKQYQLEYADWQRDVEIFKDIEAAFELAVKGEDSVPNNTVQKDGEIIFSEKELSQWTLVAKVFAERLNLQT